VLEQRAAQRDAAALTTGALVDELVGGRQVQLGHRRLDMAVQLPRVLVLDLGLQLLELGHDLVHVLGRQVLAELHAQLLVPAQQFADRRHREFDVLAHGPALDELGLLRHVADGASLGEARDAVVLLVLPRHDAEHGRLAGAVLADHADLGVLEEDEADVVEDGLLALVGLGEPLERKDG